MKRILTSFAFVAASLAFAQVSITGDADATPRATLDVQAIPNSDKPDGILIPNINKDRAQLMELPETSTLVYMKNDGTGGDRTVNVDADGFYYFDRTAGTSGEWVKVGAPTSSKTIRAVEQINVSDWANGQYALVQTTNADIHLPPAAGNENRIISVANGSTGTANYADPAPYANSRIIAGKGQLLMSDGNEWYVIGGL